MSYIGKVVGWLVGCSHIYAREMVSRRDTNDTKPKKAKIPPARGPRGTGRSAKFGSTPVAPRGEKLSQGYYVSMSKRPALVACRAVFTGRKGRGTLRDGRFLSPMVRVSVSDRCGIGGRLGRRCRPIRARNVMLARTKPVATRTKVLRG